MSEDTGGFTRGRQPFAVLDGRTGRVVDGTDLADVAMALAATLPDPERAAAGAAGRRWVRETWSWDASARHLAELLSPEHVLPALSRQGPAARRQ